MEESCFVPTQEKGRDAVVAGCEPWGGAPALQPALQPAQTLSSQDWQAPREKNIRQITLHIMPDCHL